MKKIIGALLGVVFASQVLAVTAITGKLIALDAGHGGGEWGAVNEKYGVKEKDVNLAVVYALRDKLTADGATVVLTREGNETIDSRKSRVDIAIEKCQLAAGRKCDVLVSVHHNGNPDPAHDGTLVVYNEKKDVSLARALHDSLISRLGLDDEGYLHGGYGMTVYGNLVSALTEAYYITNDQEAEIYLAGTRTPQEVEALYGGILKYFEAKTSKGRR
ncbi:MAG: N-acetylmuramoyl-L-alanine amidase [Patescibacteria group bacterium]